MDDAVKQDILERIPQGWLGSIDTGPGWDTIIAELHTQIKQIYPDYSIHQIKEKFGGLRYYIGACPAGDEFVQINSLISDAESLSYKICEQCGQPGQLRRGGWLRTLCDEHAEGRPAYEDAE